MAVVLVVITAMITISLGTFVIAGHESSPENLSNVCSLS
jgi:hypothetical protein